MAGKPCTRLHYNTLIVRIIVSPAAIGTFGTHQSEPLISVTISAVPHPAVIKADSVTRAESTVVVKLPRVKLRITGANPADIGGVPRRGCVLPDLRLRGCLH